MDRIDLVCNFPFILGWDDGLTSDPGSLHALVNVLVFRAAILE
jgi:hypothetical protein